ncbi:Non-specific serine/threonine protein kinase [Sulfidibacter corallicola]|uniref:Serine/threonine protein kinase n=1 Tax=Sulfidibacter corallicola TaxID=2818388 RepID=A0A8A4THW2_SULCO|nr:serine/threonine-protein kinase [Sulfidibacter corallicola]QTD48411.1 serine/threonine protein kinase [Sulfidibacter corallicola]
MSPHKERDEARLRELDAYFEAVADGEPLDARVAGEWLGLEGDAADRLGQALASNREIELVTGFRWVDRPIAVPGYDIERKIGSGGLSDVYLAHKQGPVHRRVALKLPRATFAPALSDFERERQILASFTHEGICHYYDTGTTEDGRPYVAMEYVEGTHIDTFVRNQDLNFDQVVDLFAEVLRTIAFAHGKGVVHCDLKPGNILVKDEDGTRIKVIDFGLGKFLQRDQVSRVLFGTQGFLAPEAIENGGLVDVRLDVYALGKVMERMLDRRKRGGPSRAHSFLERQKRQFLQTILARATEPDPDRRYPTVEALLRDVARLNESQPPVGMRESRWTRLIRSALVHKARTTIVALASGFLLFFPSYVYVAQRHEARAIARERDAALAAQKKAEAHQRFMVSLFTDAGPHRQIGELTVASFIEDAHRRLDLDAELPEEGRLDLLRTLIDVNLAVGNHDSALAATDMVISEDPSFEMYLRRIEVLYAAGNIEAMKQALDELADALPRLTSRPPYAMDHIRYFRALAFHNQNRFFEAVAEMERMTEPRQPFPLADLHLASFYMLTDNDTSARRMLHELLALGERLDDTQLLLHCHLTLSRLYLSLGCLDLADQHVVEAIAHHQAKVVIPHAAEAHLLMQQAGIRVIARDYEQADALLNRAGDVLDQWPINSELYSMYFNARFGLAYGKMDYPLAAHWLSQMESQARNDFRDAWFGLYRHWMRIAEGRFREISSQDYQNRLNIVRSQSGSAAAAWHVPFLMLLLAKDGREAAFERVAAEMDRFLDAAPYQEPLLRGLFHLRRAEALSLFGRADEAASARQAAQALLGPDEVARFQLVPDQRTASQRARDRR